MTSAYLPNLAPDAPSLVEHERFWRYCGKGELRFQQCGGCERVQHPPSPRCANCGSPRLRWIPASDDAELFSFTVVHHAADPALVDAVPYNVAIVAFPSLQWVRVVSNVVDAAAHELRIGMPLVLAWRNGGPGGRLPLFRRVRDA